MTRKRLVLAAAMGFGIVAATVLLWSQPSHAQLSPGAAIPQGDENQPFILGGSIIVVVSPTNDAVIAYSKHTGTWQRQPVEARPKKPIMPTVSNEVAVFQAGNKFYAFSGMEGRWDTLTLNEGVQSDWHITHDMAFVYRKNQYHAFSAETANWASLKMEAE